MCCLSFINPCSSCFLSCRLFFPKAGTGFLSAFSKGAKPSGAGRQSGSSRKEGGALRGCNYRLHSPVKTGPVGCHHTAQKAKRRSHPGSHSRTAGLFVRYVGRKRHTIICLTRLKIFPYSLRLQLTIIFISV